MAKQYKFAKYYQKKYIIYIIISRILNFLGGEFPYIKVTFHDNRFNEVVTILFLTKTNIHRNIYIIEMINTQNGEDCKTFFDRLNLDRIAHLCKCQPDNQIKFYVEYQMMN